ncbi:MAG: apolipoprotein N-acyltransferase [Bacteroidota bacterium]|nr:apolipoprotein N-acyltransferase [Bacteroidota bacterium]
MKRFTNLAIALSSGLLLWAAWPVSPLTFFIFFAWIPLLWLESTIKSRKKFFGLTYITMLTWNVMATWWIWNASEPGAIAAFLANSLLMCFPWLGFKIVKKWLGEKMGYASLIAFWMCFEFIHLQDWGLSWPWLTLGNVFATHPDWIQWYSYTGTSGGTLWVMLVNIFLFLHLKNNYKRQTAKTYTYLVTAILLLMFPVMLSRISYTHKDAPGPGSNIVVVQPNIDPYEKVSEETGSFGAQLSKLIHLSEQATDDNTVLVVWPETALYTSNGIEEDKMKENFFLNPLWGFLQRHPRINLFTGVESYKVYDSKITSTAKSGGPGFYYDSFNGSALLDSSGTLAFYHKSMLVPGVETLPWFLKFIDTWFEKFGGTTAGYAKQKERTVLTTKGGYKIAPAICYESIYGEFMSQYIRNGANLICIITNDGWWKNTPGYKQHMSYARLRAIETGKWVARSANTGISCFIDPYGNVFDPQPWDTAAAIKMSVPASTEKTFFVTYGDILSRIITVLSLLPIAWTLTLWVMKKFFNNKKRILPVAKNNE